MSSGREQDRPQTVPGEKPETTVERLKPLWLCDLRGGRWRTRTSYLVRLKLTPRLFRCARVFFKACFRASAFVLGTPGHPGTLWLHSVASSFWRSRSM